MTSARFPILEFLEKTILELIPPFVANKGHFIKDVESFTKLHFIQELTGITIYFAKHNTVSRQEASLIQELHRHFETYEARYSDIKRHQALIKELHQSFGEAAYDNLYTVLFASLFDLENYDTAYGTNFTDKVKEMFWRYANCIIEFHNHSAEEKEVALSELRQVLYPSSLPVTIGDEEHEETKDLAPSSKSEVIRYYENIIPELNKGLEAAIWWDWKPGNPAPSPSGAIFVALSNIASHFASLDGNISLSKATLLKEIVDIVDPSYTNLPPTHYRDQMESQIKKQPNRSNLTVPRTIPYLQRYDSVNGTDHAEKAKELYWRFAKAVIESDGNITKEKKDALSEFRQMLYQIPDEQPKLKSSPQCSDMDFFRYINRTIDELSKLVQEIDFLVRFGNGDWSNYIPSGLEIIIKDLTLITIRFAAVNNAIPESEINLLRAVRCLYDEVYDDRSLLPSAYTKFILDQAKDWPELHQETFWPKCIIYAGVYDKKYGTRYGEKAKALCFRFANTIVKADGRVTRKEEVALFLFKDNVAGYTNKMNTFLLSNPGLRSRFNKYFAFEDYAPSQLIQIFELFCNNASFQLSQSAREKASAIFRGFYENRDETFGNARLARNIFERALNHQANRVISLSDINDQILSTIEAIDIPSEVELHTIK